MSTYDHWLHRDPAQRQAMIRATQARIRAETTPDTTIDPASLPPPTGRGRMGAAQLARALAGLPAPYRRQVEAEHGEGA